ncbi:MFS transporter [Mycobacteroides abscessus]|uniref:MFS transporter n=1 Tax=Mycobacteroides abscessus TaxID=36809 RepID=UPI00092ADD41|nr:MFS transporter [Mycobacteroides abscessus]SIK23547.1 H+ antiporter protein [Mycobacteroides abscessus subsp. abscessus]SIM51787.1 H+ antiporter protein [Mycobacteroides abscessus subsp. abscessus]SLF28803.1 H+ antiporter protein [Mycobacteroides abscessus subsp. abscessus]SLH61002.1 H+ antiporter protein [Mycobacteroides abscessus subsp. abscessus]
MSLFSYRDYRRLFAAQVVALFGTGLTTVALGLLAYQLAGADAAAVLGTALAIKMIAYVAVAPIAAAHADRFPRRLMLVSLDVIRATVVMALPFIDQVWQIYVLIAVLQSASAAFTPTFQAVIPEVVTDESDYTAALSASQLASTMENLLSPVVAALLLTVMSFHWLFLGTVIGFLISAVLVIGTRIPDASRNPRASAWDKIAAGIRIFAATPRLRGVLALNLAVAAAGSIIMVNTVNYVRDALGRSQANVAWLLAAGGTGTMLVALLLPPVLRRVPERNVMMAGGVLLVFGAAGAIGLTATHADQRWSAALVIWTLIGAGMSLVLTPVGRVLRRSSTPADRPAVFAAQFSLSHLCWLLTYPIAGWVATLAGFRTAWTMLEAIAAVGAVAALLLWPRTDPEELTHTHDDATTDSHHLDDATTMQGGRVQHTHVFVIDRNHLRWPDPTK